MSAHYLAALVAALALVGTAAAEAPRAKRMPEKVTAAAGEAFAAAVAADEAGDLRLAHDLYKKAFAIAPHPSAVFNLGDVQRRLGELAAALRSYETYLALAPGAPDRAAVEALITRIARTPGTIRLTTTSDVLKAVDLLNGYVLVDGEIKRRPGAQPPLATGADGVPVVVIDTLPGEHQVDVVTALTHARTTCTVKPGARTECRVSAAPRIDGALVVSGDARVGVVVAADRTGSEINKRLTIPAGKHRLMVRDRSYECAPLLVDVPADDMHVVYAYLGTSEYDRLERCRTLTVRQHTLEF